MLLESDTLQGAAVSASSQEHSSLAKSKGDCVQLHSNKCTQVVCRRSEVANSGVAGGRRPFDSASEMVLLDNSCRKAGSQRNTSEGDAFHVHETHCCK